MTQRKVYVVPMDLRTNPLSKTEQPHTVLVHHIGYSTEYTNVRHTKRYLEKVFSSHPRPIAVDVDNDRYWTSDDVKRNDRLSESLRPECYLRLHKKDPSAKGRSHRSSQDENSLPF